MTTFYTDIHTGLLYSRTYLEMTPLVTFCGKLLRKQTGNAVGCAFETNVSGTV